MNIVTVPRFIERIFPTLVWRLPADDKPVYLTFDDGPIPEVTPWVLDELDKFNVKATFFCVGDNVAKHPKEYRMVIERGHCIGNHTYNHLQGIKTNSTKYLKNIEKAGEVIDSKLFRPPHGLMRRKQLRTLVSENKYRIIMWHVLSCDYDCSLKPSKCLSNVVDNVENGSIIVFHDSLKAEKNMRYALPRVLENLSNRGFGFRTFD